MTQANGGDLARCVAAHDPASLSFRVWKRVAVVLVLGAMVGCDSLRPNSESRRSDPNENELSGVTFFDHSDLELRRLHASLLSDAPAIGRPTQIRLVGDFLWIMDAASDPGLHVLDAETGELLHSLGTRGEGPGEFRSSPFGMEAASGDKGAVWAWDMGLQRLTRFEPRPLSEYDLVTIRLRGEPRVFRIAWPTPDKIIGVAHSDVERFSIFSPDGERKESVAGALLGPESVPLRVRLNLSNSSIKVCTWPGRGFAIANFVVGRIEYYDTAAQFVRTANVPYPSEPHFVENEDGDLGYIPRRSWYFDCTAVGDLLYTVFSGRLRSAYDRDESSSAEFIHVFEWDGDLRAAFQVDRPIRGIAVNEDHSVLYAVSLSDAGVYRIDLPALAMVPDE